MNHKLKLRTPLHVGTGNAVEAVDDLLRRDAQEGSDDGVASRLIIYDAPLDKNPQTAIRDGVGIDRATGAAARKERLKFDLEIVPAETPFSLRRDLIALLSAPKASQPTHTYHAAAFDPGVR